MIKRHTVYFREIPEGQCFQLSDQMIFYKWKYNKALKINSNTLHHFEDNLKVDYLQYYHVCLSTQNPKLLIDALWALSILLMIFCLFIKCKHSWF